MPLQSQSVPVPLGGLDQKVDRLGRRMGSLDLAINATFDKAAEAGVRIDKRRGYQRIDPADTVNLFDTDSVLTHCTTLGKELVIFTYDFVAAIGSRETALRGIDALVYRGPCNRGACRMTFVSQARVSQEVVEVVAP